MFKLTVRHNYNNVVIVLALLLLATSCANPKKFTYFNDLPKDSAMIHLESLPWPAYSIQKDDILEIKVSGKSDVSTIDFNLKSGGFGNGQSVIPQYLVNKDGEINFYQIGNMKVEGLTIEELSKKIQKAVEPFLSEAVVNARVLNFRFTVLGEVKQAGTFSVNNERLSVLEALGFAGDMTYFSQRNRIKIFRDSSGIRTVGFLDFSTKKVLNSPYYYLRRNDVIYVETNTRYRQVTDSYTRLALVVGTLSSLIATVAILYK